MFQFSTTVIVSAVQQIGDTVGATGDTEMTTRAWRSLNAALKYFNNRAKWAWLLTEANPITLVAPFNVVVTASGGSAHLTAGASHGVLVDDLLSGYSMGLGFRVSATAGTTGIYLNASATGFTGTASVTLSAVRDFYDLPSNWKAAYSVRLASNNTWLAPVNRRAYDRLVSDEFSPSTPAGYDISQVATKGKVRFVPPPGAAGTVQVRYHRKMATATASGDNAATLDILADYEDNVIAYGKWHFLTDKSEGRADQGKTWLAVAKEGLVMMLADQTNQPDEDLGFSPGHTQSGTNINSTRAVAWDTA